MTDLIQVAGARGGSPAVTPGLFPWAYAPMRLYDKGHDKRGSVSGGQGQDRAGGRQHHRPAAGGPADNPDRRGLPQGRYLHALIERRRQEHLIDIGRSMGHLAWVTREQAEQINEWYASRRAIYPRLQSRVRRW